MDMQQFKDALLHHAQLVAARHELCKTEEASKTSLILPFFRDVLGYDVDDPSVFIPEFVSAISVKKDQRVDYAILRDGKPEILIEAKWNGYSLDGYESQLYNYFSATSAKLGILTNGVIYRFFGDLDSDNRMDITPFREINMLALAEKDMEDLAAFHRDTFDIEAIVGAATEMKYSSEVIALLDRLFSDPDNEFTAFIMKRVYNGKKTAKSAKNFQTIVKRSIDQYLADRISAGIAAIQEANKPEEPAQEDNGIITTQEEIEAYYIIRTLLHQYIDPARVQYKDCRSYFAVLLDGKTTQWICRLYPVNDALWQIHYPTEEAKKPEKQILQSNDDLYACQDRLRRAVQKYL
ncbi:MAG: type I restriction enzyme HsdR N-terminal domain-containing protein [Clostridia bacterium]|nr:type I restriction enzyme HsdR N-terminal domain-containing protein [Clostridia bacterium]